jgi:ABC-2 type transport system permease protein
MKTADRPLPRTRTAFRGFTAFFLCELRVQFHEETAILTSLIVQAVLLTFVWVLAPGLFGIALVGAILFSLFTLGQRVLNEAAYVRIDHKLNEMFLASPLAPEAYFLGMAAGVLVAYLPPILLLGGIASQVLRPSVLTALVLIGAAGAIWIFSCSVGYVLSTAFRDQRAIWSYASILYNLFGVLPPVFYPLYLFPTDLRPVALVLPPSGAAALVQQTINPGTLSYGEIALAAISLVVTAVASFAIAIWWARRSVRDG